jgi:dolichol-phosphate mannosyltransferase
MTATMAPAPEISVVIAAHNEAENIAPMCQALAPLLSQYGSYEIVFVEDGSSDATLEAIRAVARLPSVRYVAFTRNFGHQAALRAGLKHSRGRAVVLMDADFEHPPELVPELVGQWRNGAMVVTTRRLDDGATTSLTRRMASHFYYRILNALGDIHIEPGSADFLLLDRIVVDAINELGDHDLFLRGVVRWLGYPRATVPYRRGARQQGVTKYSLRRRVELAVMGIASHSIRPLRFAIWLALGFAALGALFVIYSIVSFLFVQHTVAGWTSIMAAIAILGAAQLLVLGIIGEYIGRILRETRKRPSYVIMETEADRREAGSPVARLNRPAE